MFTSWSKILQLDVQFQIYPVDANLCHMEAINLVSALELVLTKHHINLVL